MPLAAGARLGPYEVLGLVGAGGMGQVYRARDPRLGRDVAIKVLPPTFADDADHLRRFEREARATGTLNHPNILSVFDVGTHEGAPYLVMEMLEGRTLRQEIGGQPLPVRRAVEIARAIAQGLAAAHEKGIVHRDLKPDNVFLTADGRVKILDFGLAKAQTTSPGRSEDDLATWTRGREPSLTEEGRVLGTAGYMSPEQARGETLDGRSDVFALGVLLHEMLAGRNPFRRATAADTLAAVLREEPESPPVSGELSKGLLALLGRCLAKAPEQRFQSARDLAFALDTLALARETARAEPAEKSLVVLPFENLSPDPDNAFFADGLTEELIADLSKVQALRVISRTSAMHFKGTTKALPEIARELNVRYALEGSVRRAGTSLRITAQLIDAAADVHLWAEKYSGTLDDVFDMQEKVSRAIVEALKVQLSFSESRKLVEWPTRDAAAYECYLRARAEVLSFEPPKVDHAVDLLDQGLRRSPGDPLLLACKAYAHHARVNVGAGRNEDLELAESLAREALQRVPDLTLCHTVLGLVTAMKPHRIVEAIRHLERAVATSPSDMDALLWLSAFSVWAGRAAAGATFSGRMISLNPVDWLSYMGLLLFHWSEGRFAEALSVGDQMLVLAPGVEVIQLMRMQPLIVLGRNQEAGTLAEWAATTGDSFWRRHIRLAWHAHRKEHEQAGALMTSGFLDSSRRDMQYSLYVAEAHAQLGEPEPALEWLENAIRMGFLNHRFLSERDPFLSPLRSHPRFQRLMDEARDEARALEESP